MLQLKISINKKENTMKNFKKILIVVLAATLLFATCMVAAFADDEYTGTVEELTKLVSKAESATGTAKHDAVIALYDYFGSKSIDPESEGYEELVARTHALIIAGIEADLAFANSTILDPKAAYDELAKADKLFALADQYLAEDYEGLAELKVKYDEAFVKTDDALVVKLVDNLAFANSDNVNADVAYNTLFQAREMFDFAATKLPDDYAGLAEAKAKYDEAVVKTANALLAKVDANILTTLDTATNKVAINKVRRVLLDSKPFGEVDLVDVWGNLTPLEKLHEQAVQINLNELEESNKIDDYELPIYYSDDMQSLPSGYVTKSGKLGTSSWHFELKNTKNPLGVLTEANGNKYIYSGYANTTETDKNTYVQLALSSYKPDRGYVMEFDLTTFDKIPSTGIKLEAGGFNMSDGRGFPPFYLVISANGDLIMGDAPNAVDQNKVTALPAALVPGQWLHIAIVFDYSEFTYTLIVDGQKLTTTSAKYKGGAFDLSQGVIRFGGADTSGSIAFDNFTLYSGSGYRNPDKFTAMTDDEKFLYYANYIARDSQDVNGKKYAYDIASELLYNYWTWTDMEAGLGEYTEYALANEDLKAAVDIYLAFDIDALVATVKADNLAAFIEMATALDEMERSIDSINDRTAKILEIDAFVLKYADLIDKETDSDGDGVTDYDTYNKIVATVNKEKTFDQNAILFIRYMNRFSQVTALNAMQRHYERAKAIVINEEESGRIDMDIVTNPDHPDRANFEELVAAYEAYLLAYDTIDAMMKKNNSDKIINCIGFINQYTTEEEWLANFDYMNKYLELVKETILGREPDGALLYDPNHEDVQVYVDFFNLAYSFFYNVQQEAHIAYLSETIELISNTEAYIEKMGMVAMMDRYVADNSLDYSDARIVSIMNALETCRAELQLREEDYAKVLVQNAVYFVNIVERIRTSTTYTEKKSFFEQAGLYYFNIDITVAGAAEAAAIYDQCAIELALIEKASLDFIESVEYYTTCESADERYAALVECYVNAQYAERSYEGVTEALELFEKEYASYMDYVETVNADVAATGAAVGSLRANCGITTIISIIIKKIFGV